MNLDSSHTFSIKQVPMTTTKPVSQQSSEKPLELSDLPPTSNELSGMMSSRSSMSHKIQEAVKINQNVKDALRNIAEKQKKNSIFELLNK